MSIPYWNAIYLYHAYFRSLCMTCDIKNMYPCAYVRSCFRTVDRHCTLILLSFEIEKIFMAFSVRLESEQTVVFTGRFETFGNLSSRFITGQHVVTFALDVWAKWVIGTFSTDPAGKVLLYARRTIFVHVKIRSRASPSYKHACFRNLKSCMIS